MITCNEYGVKCKGRSYELLCELTNIMTLFYENEIADKEMLEECVMLSTMTDKEIHELASKKKSELKKNFEEFMGKYNDDNDDEEFDPIDEILKHLRKGEDDE